MGILFLQWTLVRRGKSPVYPRYPAGTPKGVADKTHPGSPPGFFCGLP